MRVFGRGSGTAGGARLSSVTFGPVSVLMALLILSVPACRFAEDLLHMSPPEVLFWQPESSDADPDSLAAVKIGFSASMDRNRTEEAFSLSADGEGLSGFFSWEESKVLTFIPREGFTPHRLYEITLSSDAEDTRGNSLLADWYGRFRTGADDEPPQILSVSPEDYSLISDLRQPVSYVFSEAVNRQSFREALSVSPALLCHQEWGTDSRSVTLSPLEDYEEGKEYLFTLGTELEDSAGHGLTESYITSYPVTDPGEALLEELRCASDGRLLEAGLLNDTLEKDTILEGRMNRPLNSGERSALISLSPSLNTAISWSVSGEAFTLNFEEPPEWESCLTLSVGDEDFLLCFDGPGSRPPEVLSLHFCADADSPGADEPRELILNGALGACDSDNAFLDIRLAPAEGAELNLSSLLEALSITSPVLTVQGLGCTEYTAGMTPAPAIPPASGEALYRIVLEVETTGLPGTVIFALEETLKDSLDNCLAEGYALTVCQP